MFVIFVAVQIAAEGDWGMCRLIWPIGGVGLLAEQAVLLVRALSVYMALN